MKYKLTENDFFHDDNIDVLTTSDFTTLSIPEKIHKINELILTFSKKRKVDICRKCRSYSGDWTKYNDYLSDTGVCTVCFRPTGVINYSILHLVKLANLDAEDYYYYKDPATSETYHGLRKANSDVKNDDKLRTLYEQQEKEWFTQTEIYNQE